MPDKDKLFHQLDSMGEATVQQKLVVGAFPKDEIKLVREWLSLKVRRDDSKIKDMPLSELEKITKHYELHPLWNQISKEYYKRISKKPWFDQFWGRVCIAVTGGIILFLVVTLINKYILNTPPLPQQQIKSQPTPTTATPKKIP